MPEKLGLIQKKWPFYVVFYKNAEFYAYDYGELLCMRQAVMGRDMV